MSQLVNDLLTGGAVSLERLVRGRRESSSNYGKGCQHCPLDDSGAHKFHRPETGKNKKLVVVAYMPSALDDEVKQPLSGKLGQMIRHELRKAGLARKDYDIQYAVRCSDSKAPPEAVKCCSIYNEQVKANNQTTTNVYLCLGKDAAQAFLARDWRKGNRASWVEYLNAYVVTTHDPRFFYETPNDSRWQDFRTFIRAAVALMQCSSEYGYLHRQDYQSIVTAQAARKELRRIVRMGKPTAVDVEDTPDKLLCLGVSNTPGRSRTIYLDHPGAVKSRRERRAIKRLLVEFLESKVVKIFHHGSHEEKTFARLLGVKKVRNYTYDTEYASYLFRSDLMRYGLDNLSQVLVPEFAGYKRIIKGYIESPETFVKTPLALMTLYNGADCDITKRLELLTRPKISLPLLRVYIDCGYVFDRMQANGPFFDRPFFNEIMETLPSRIAKLERAIKLAAGKPTFNVRKQQDVKWLIYEKLGCPDVSGQQGTDKGILSQIAELGYPLADKVNLCRSLMSLRSTYAEKYSEAAKKHKGRVITKWWLTGAKSGRIRSGGSNKTDGITNLQNIASSPMVKNLLVSDPRWRLLLKYTPKRAIEVYPDISIFVASDYSQIELRQLAEISRDPLLIKQFKARMDIHASTGHAITGKPFQLFVDDDVERRKIKAFNFGVVYGLSPEGIYKYFLSQKIEATLDMAQRYHASYFERYQGVKKYIVKQRRFAERYNFVRTMFGFKRDIYLRQAEEGTYWGNQAINTPIQGTAHQLLLIAIAALRSRYKEFRLLQNVCLEVHDALVFRTPISQLLETVAATKRLFEDAVPEQVSKLFKIDLVVPLVTDSKAGFRYGVMEGVKNVNSNEEFLAKWRESNAEACRESEAKAKAA